MQSNISKIVREHGIKAGEPMKNIHGEVIANSVVLSNYQVLISREGPFPGYDLLYENPLDGEQSTVSLSTAAFAVLQSFKGDA